VVSKEEERVEAVREREEARRVSWEEKKRAEGYMV